MRKWLGLIITVVIVILYVMWGIIAITPTGRSILVALAEGALILGLGISLSNTMDMQGELDAENTDDFKGTKKGLATSQVNAKPHIYKADIFCAIKNRNAYHSVRENMLKKVSLVYEDYFDEDGRFIGKLFEAHESDTDEIKQRKNNRNKIILSCLNLNITTITKGDLESENDKPMDPLYAGRNKAQFNAQRNVKNIVMKIITAILGASFMATFVGLDWGAVLYKLMVGIFLIIMGLVSYVIKYRFINGEYRQRLITKADWNDELVLMSEKGLLVYKDEVEVKKDAEENTSV